MNELTIECPSCAHNFVLSETLAMPLLEAERKKHQESLARQSARLAKERAQLKKLEKSLQNTEKVVEQRLAEERKALESKVRKDVTKDLQQQLAHADQQLADKDKKLRIAEKAELQARRLKAEAEEDKRKISLTVQRKIDSARQSILTEARRVADEQHARQLAEKDQELEVMRKQAKELTRKANSRSQQMQGDLQEVDIAELLSGEFPGDTIERTGRGQKGADILQKVSLPSGHPAGMLLVEVKDTKHWDRKWLAKLREDAQRVDADMAVLISTALPANVEQFAFEDGVWICARHSLVPLVTTLRIALLEVARARRATHLADDMKEVVYNYLTSPIFAQRITRVVGAYSELRKLLDTQKRTFNRTWAQQEQELNKIIGSISSVYGDLQSLAGSALKPVDGLTLQSPVDVTDGDAIDQPFARAETG